MIAPWVSSCELEIDRRAFADREILGGLGEGAIEADPARIDGHVLQLIAALALGERLELGGVPHRARGDDVELAALIE